MFKHLLIILCLSLCPVPALAQDGSVRDRVLSILRDDGFREVRINRTFLGRLRFVAENREERREIIVNPATGVILRDYVRFLSDNDGSSGSAFGGGSGNDDDGDVPSVGSDDDDHGSGGRDDNVEGDDDDDDDGDDGNDGDDDDNDDD